MYVEHKERIERRVSIWLRVQKTGAPMGAPVLSETIKSGVGL